MEELDFPGLRLRAFAQARWAPAEHLDSTASCMIHKKESSEGGLLEFYPETRRQQQHAQASQKLRKWDGHLSVILTD